MIRKVYSFIRIPLNKRLTNTAPAKIRTTILGNFKAFLHLIYIGAKIVKIITLPSSFQKERSYHTRILVIIQK